MRDDAMKTTVLSLQMIPNADPVLLQNLKLPRGMRSLGIITTDCDDVSYAALDEATKKANVTVA
ncbi:MAG: BMC domain-containing protein, partial [Clostridia bacterium]|nr:BMC domain-containing protein [Clostridia bacterium]